MSDLETYEPIGVRRVQTDTGSHVEPPLDQSWDDLTKLRWHAGVVLADAGVEVGISTGAYQRHLLGRWWTVPGHYSITIGNSSHSSYTFDEAWTFINGIEAGAKAARLAVPPEDQPRDR